MVLDPGDLGDWVYFRIPKIVYNSTTESVT